MKVEKNGTSEGSSVPSLSVSPVTNQITLKCFVNMGSHNKDIILTEKTKSSKNNKCWPCFLYFRARFKR